MLLLRVLLEVVVAEEEERGRKSERVNVRPRGRSVAVDVLGDEVLLAEGW